MIKHPMDFGTMEEKIQRGEYKDVEGFKVSLIAFGAEWEAANAMGN